MIKHDEIPVSENDLSSYGLDTPELAIVVDYTVDMTYDSLRHQEVFRADFKDVYQLYILFLIPQICWGEIEFIPKKKKKKLYGQARTDVRESIQTLCRYKMELFLDRVGIVGSFWLHKWLTYCVCVQKCLKMS